MKTRVISAIAAIVLLVSIVYLGRIAIGLAIFVIAAVGIYEFYRALSRGGHRPVYAAGFISCLPLLYLAAPELFSGLTASAGIGPEMVMRSLAAGLFILLVLLFCLLIFSNGKYKVTDISVTLFGIAYVVFLSSFVTLTRNMQYGYLSIWMIFIGAWATDTFAFFTGISIGKRKILPKISPKKTVEGCIGGVLGCMAVMTLFGVYSGNVFDVPLYHFIILGGICGVVSQIGDWAASAVKRAMDIKDYGNIMPGHGGVLDRVDSILFTAPVVYFYISMFF